MRESLTIRAYKPSIRTHTHHFHQVVVPLCGVIEISIDDFDGIIPVGHCVIIQKNVEHSFKAKKDARFLVADIYELPKSALSLDCPFATVSNSFKSFCLFTDIQLSSQVDSILEESMISVFKQLLSFQDFLPSIDRRISKALEYIDNDLSKDHTLETIAAVSSLSISQFKVLFAKSMKMTLSQYLLTQRMEQARALLANTDMPINIIAEKFGYLDQSAFARRFKKYHGISPSEYKKQ